MASPEPRRLGPLAAVLGLHLLLLFALLKAGVWRDRTPPVRAPAVITLWLPTAPPAARAAQPPAPATTPRRMPPGPARPARERGELPAAPPAFATPAPALEAPAAAALPAEPAAAAASAAPAPALRLDLPRAAALPRSPALDDPRANRARPTLESQIAAALGGDGAWSEEHVAEGVTRYRRGRECVEVRETRDVALDPFNQSVKHKPRQAGNC